VDRERSASPASHANGAPTPAEAHLLEQLRKGDAAAGQELVREYYPGIYRHLLYLTGKPEMAEDLTQETFLQAWRHLHTFAGRASLKTWLHRIAHREFLRALGRQRPQACLEAIPEVPAPRAADLMAGVELRSILCRLPVEEREIVILHYLEGYSSAEIAQILRAPAGTIRFRLAQAREHLRQELGEDDLTYLNEPLAPMRQWHWLPLDQMHALEARLTRGSAGDRADSGRGASQEEAMERREFLRHAAAGAAGLMLSDAEKEVVDGRLTQKVTLAFKATALSDVCDRLHTETCVHLTAGASVADEKVTLFCQKTPLREVMRQLSRPFGYTWVRNTRKGEYRYELLQDLRSQLLEEELRNRDRRAALLVLEREMERYRPYRDLSPDEALARVEGASPAEKPLLERLSGFRWGAIQAYFQLSPADLVTLRTVQKVTLAELAAPRSVQKVTFRADPKPGEHPLPPELARGVLQSNRKKRVRRHVGGFEVKEAEDLPDGLPFAAVPEARADEISLWMDEKELGHFILWGGSGIGLECGDGSSGIRLQGGDYSFSPIAEGRSPSVLHPQNQITNARLAGDRSLKRVVHGQFPAHGSRVPEGPSTESKVTSADVLEVLHRATGLPIVADFYTRLYAPEVVSAHDQPLFDALNELADAMRLRWYKEGDWLQFRSVSFYDDRRKEVPNRLLARWAARKQQRFLALDALIEIAQLSDAQLDAEGMAEGARLLWGLAEWELPRNRNLRPHLRFLGSLRPAQRQAAISLSPGGEPADTQGPHGLGFRRLDLAQQQQFAALAFVPNFGPAGSLEELIDAALSVVYTQPGGYEWRPPEPGLEDEYPPLRPSPVRERTAEAALAAAQRLDPGATAAQVHPTALELTFAYTRPIERGLRTHRACSRGNWGQDLVTDPTRPSLAPGS
jgi:RNA polymerase sigma-70 factor, ECF subfamily